MTSSKVGPYYFEHKKKHLEIPLSAWFEIVVGDASFELATPAVWRQKTISKTYILCGLQEVFNIVVRICSTASLYFLSAILLL